MRKIRIARALPFIAIIAVFGATGVYAGNYHNSASNIIDRIVPKTTFTKQFVKGAPTGYATSPTITDLYDKSVSYISSPQNHNLSTTSSSGSISINIDSTTYYFTPNEGEDFSVLSYMAGNSSALVETTDSSKAVFTVGGVMYTYDTDMLKQSAYSGDDYTLTKTVYGDPSSGDAQTVSVNVMGNSQTITYYSGIDDVIGETLTSAKTVSSGSVDYDFVGNTREGMSSGGIVLVTGSVDHINSNFIGNYAYGNTATTGGTLYVNGFVGSVQGDFISNGMANTINSGTTSRNMNGGAIAVGNGKIVGSVIGDFIGNYIYNYRGQARGGAIYNTGEIGFIKGNFENNYSYGTGTSYGGAVGNAVSSGSSGTITFIDSNFKNNAVTSAQGGAIWNNNGATLNILAVDSDSVFSGNLVNATITKNSDGTFSVSGGESNAIYNATSTVNLNAADGKNIIFDDDITLSNAATSVLNINNSITYNTYDAEGNAISQNVGSGKGTVQFNNTVTTGANSVINFYDGVLQFGEDGEITGGGHFNVYGGTVSTQNENIGTKSLSNLTLNDDLGLMIDIALTGDGSGDVITSSNTISSSAYGIILNAINIMAEDGVDNEYTILIASDSLKNILSLNADELIVTGGVGTYTDFVYSDGYLTFNAIYSSPIESLYDAVSVTGTRTYSLQETDELLDNGDLGAMGGKILVINGEDRTVDGNENSGIVVGEEQTLMINNSEWTNFETDSDGSVISSSGNVVLNNVNLSNNTAEGNGGAISAVDSDRALTVIDTNFSNNTSGENGGAIYTNDTTVNIIANEDVTFSGNSAGEESNDIYQTTTENDYAVLNINVDTDATVSFDGTIKSDGGEINVNASGLTYHTNVDNDITQTGGTVVFNDSVENYDIYVHDGSVNINNVGDTTLTYDSDGYVNGAVVDKSFNGDGYVSVINYGNVDIEGTTFDSNLLEMTINKTGSDSSVSDYAGGTVVENYGDIDLSGENASNFVNNELDVGLTVSGSSNKTVNVYGGAIYNEGDITGLNANFINNKLSDESTSEDETKAIVNVYGGGLYSSGLIGDVQGEFYGNSVSTKKGTADGGALYLDGTVAGNIESNFVSNSATSDKKEATGGAMVLDYSYVEGIKGDFVSNSATSDGGAAYGGAVSVKNGSTVGDVESNFKNNSVNSTGNARGGAIHVVDGSSVLNITGDFENNSINATTTAGNYTLGGAVAVEGVDSVINSITGSFSGNYIETTSGNYARGGVIYNEGQIGYVTGDFENNYVYATDADNTKAHGGAIYNTGQGAVMTVIDSNFRNNAVEGDGGAIYNDSGATLNILAVESDVVFSGNESGQNITHNEDGTFTIEPRTTRSYAIFNGDSISAGTNMNLNAAEGQSIIFDDAITGSTGLITINKALTYETYSYDDDGNLVSETHDVDAGKGTIVINDDVRNNTIVLYDGVLKLGENGEISNSQNEKNRFIAEGGRLDLQDEGDNKINDKNLGYFDLNNDMRLSIDVDMANKDGDTISAKNTLDGESTTARIILDSINIISDPTEDITSDDYRIHIADDSLKDVVVLSPEKMTVSGYSDEYSFIVQYIAADGELAFDYGDLYTAVHMTADPRAYIMNGDEEVTDKGDPAGLGEMAGEGSTLSVNGNGYAINGNGYEGITVNDGQTLGIADVGSMNGFTTAITNNEGGTVNLTDTILEDNETDIVNNGTVNFYGDNFVQNINGDNGVINVGNDDTAGNVVFDEDGAVTQKEINMSDGSTVENYGTTTVENLNGDGTFENIDGGVLNITDDGESSGNIVNDGVNEDGAPSTVNNNGNITGDVVNKNGGEIVNNGTMSGAVDNQADSTIESALEGITGENGAVNNDGTITFSSSDKPESSTLTDITGNGRVVLDTGDDSTVRLNHDLDNNTLVHNSGTLIFDSQKEVAAFETNGGTVHAANGKTEDHVLGDVTGDGVTNLTLDFDLGSQKSDRFLNNGVEGATFNVTDVKVSGKTQKDHIKIHLGDATTLGRDNVTSDTFNLPSVMTPIRRLKGKVSDGYLTYSPSGNSYKDFNPSILAAPVAAQLGGYLTALNAYDEAFNNLDMKMLMTQEEREAYKYANKYASSEIPQVYSPLYLPETDKALWLRPYSTFERVNLKRGPHVSNILYGSYFGGDSPMYQLKHGFDFQYSGYVGYTGSHQAFMGNDIYQNGGMIGATATFWKGNFFTALTATVGASVADISTRMGSEDLTMLMSGIATKTGYNWELARGKFIIQPHYLMSYTFVNAFSYTNAAGVKIDSDPLNAINIAPGLKFIGNLKNGWQPYLTVQMVWNILDKTDFQAADISLPYMSVKPYVQYGIGIQRRWGDRFTGFFQTVIRNGGRNGVALGAGLRWSIGDEHNADYSKRSVIKTKKGSYNKKLDTISENKEMPEIEFKPTGDEFTNPNNIQEKNLIRDIRPSDSMVKPIERLNKSEKGENFNFEWRAPDLIRN